MARQVCVSTCAYLFPSQSSLNELTIFMKFDGLEQDANHRSCYLFAFVITYYWDYPGTDFTFQVFFVSRLRRLIFTSTVVKYPPLTENESSVICDLTPFSQLKVCQLFGGICLLYLHVGRRNEAKMQRQVGDKQSSGRVQVIGKKGKRKETTRETKT
jgi:hypothetical protein